MIDTNIESDFECRDCLTLKSKIQELKEDKEQTDKFFTAFRNEVYPDEDSQPPVNAIVEFRILKNKLQKSESERAELKKEVERLKEELHSEENEVSYYKDLYESQLKLSNQQAKRMNNAVESLLKP